ncbi:MAG TPA: glycosyltransferase family 2 protein, partial [Candidatus Limnocylindria bacterium]
GSRARMRARLLAGAILAGAALIGWLSITSTLVARLLQGAIVLSLFYVGYLAWRGYLVMRRAITGAEPATAAHAHASDLARLSVVVPAANEASVIGGIVGDLAFQHYEAAADDLELVVIDDGSSDGTADAARAASSRVRVLRREPGSGAATKGAALAWAAPQLRGDLVAVLDADSRVAPDFLRAAVRAWQRDRTAAALQVQRRAINRTRGWLPAAQDEEQLMDMASQCGRWATDGTAELRGNGMFVRREALERAGGWPTHALTEDLDLSTRLTGVGERVVLAPEVVVQEQAVEGATDLWQQRLRWAEGSLRRLIEHGPGLVGNRQLPFGRRLDFLLFIGEFLIPPVFVTSIAASLLTIPLPEPADWTVPVTLFVGYGLGTYLLALAGLAAQGEPILSLLGRATRGALFLSHWLLIVPAALLRITFGPANPTFARTPRITPGA